MKILALDYDGVICDSVAETGISGWKCATRLWPALFPETTMPETLVADFRRVRPFLETGFQAAILVRMLREKCTPDDFRLRLGEHTNRILQESGMTRDDIIAEFGKTRDTWVREDCDGWLNAHGYFPGTITALQAALQHCFVAILTTKQERFVLRQLASQGVVFPPEQLWGLDRKAPKEEICRQFLRQGHADITFVEDRLPTLRRFQQDPELAPVKLCYAVWGYGTQAEIQEARDDKSLRALDLPEFCAMLANC
jgi:hypothetical protein